MTFVICVSVFSQKQYTWDIFYSLKNNLELTYNHVSLQYKYLTDIFLPENTITE